MKYPLLVALVSILSLSACSHTNNTTTVQSPAQESSKAPSAAPQHSSAIPATINQMQVDQMIPEVELQILEPAPDQLYQPGQDVEVKVALSKYEIGNEIGQHIHVIVDNKDYAAHYTTDHIVLKGLSEGTHSLRIFPARHYHLSLKTPGVFKQVSFHVGQKSPDYTFDPSKPYITYSRPKGTYTVEAAQKGLLLDFYVQNATLGQDARVIYSVDGVESSTEVWEPVMLPPMGVGKHKIGLKLVDMQGNPLHNGDFNDNLREIEVK